MRAHTVRSFTVAALAIAASACGFHEGLRPAAGHPLMRSPILVEMPGVHPVQIVVDIDGSGNTVGAMAMFGPGGDIGKLAKALDARYARWRVGSLKYTWRVEDQRFALALTQEGDWVTMFYLPFADTRRPTYVTGPCSCDAAHSTRPKSN